MIVNTVYVWNHLQSCCEDFILRESSTNKLKEIELLFS